MSAKIMMSLQTNLPYRYNNEFNPMTNGFWSRTPQPNKYRAIMQDKNGHKKRRHQSEQSKHQNANNKSPATPILLSNRPQPQLQSSPFYAGSKFSEAPLPSFLPRPPSSWLPAQISETNNDDLKKLDNDSKKTLNNITSATNVKVIEQTITIVKHGEKSVKINDESNENGNRSNHTSSSKYYSERKIKTDSASSTGAMASFQYNFRNTRRNTPQCQTKCKNTRYSSFSRQNIHQKIAAVN